MARKRGGLEILVVFCRCSLYLCGVRSVTKQVPWVQRRWVQVLSVGLCIGSLALYAKKRPVPSVPTTSLRQAPACAAPAACVCAPLGWRSAANATPDVSPAWEEDAWRSSLPMCTLEERQGWVERDKAPLAALENGCATLPSHPVFTDEKYSPRENALRQCINVAVIYLRDSLVADDGKDKRCEPLNRLAGLQLLTRLCEQERDTRSCRMLALGYRLAENFAAQPQQALQLLRNTCAQENVGCSTLGTALANPASPVYNPREALPILEIACKEEGGSSCLHVLRIREQAGAPFVGAERLRWLVRACDGDNDATRQACEEVSKVILDGRWSLNGVPVPAASPINNAEATTPVPEPAQATPTPAPPVPAAPAPVPTPPPSGAVPQPPEAPPAEPLPEEPVPPLPTEETPHE